MSVKQPRYFVETLIDSETLSIGGDEAHHLLNVMRVSIGDEIVLFDGSGSEFDAMILSKSRKELTVSIKEKRAIDRELPYQLSAIVSLPKGDRQKILVEKLVELGTTCLVPLTTRRSVAQPTDAALTRLRKHVIAASKQCGRNRLMEIAEPQTMQNVLLTAIHGNENCLVADPSAAQALIDFAPRRQPTRIIIGPEGGFELEELDQATKTGWRIVNLGPRILRVETAAFFAASLIVGKSL